MWPINYSSMTPQYPLIALWVINELIHGLPTCYYAAHILQFTGY